MLGPPSQHPALQLELVEGLQRWRWRKGKARDRERGERERMEERKKGLGRESKDRQMEKREKVTDMSVGEPDVGNSWKDDD